MQPDHTPFISSANHLELGRRKRNLRRLPLVMEMERARLIKVDVKEANLTVFSEMRERYVPTHFSWELAIVGNIRFTTRVERDLAINCTNKPETIMS